LSRADLTPIVRTKVLRVAATLRAERMRQGLNLLDLAKRMGLNRSVIYGLESGRHANPTILTLERVARGLGCEIELSVRQCVED
jgi:transcriptional regulator with XRE-family HTH domain